MQKPSFSYATAKPRQGAIFASSFGFPISELTTLGIVCYVAHKLWYQTRFTPMAWVSVFSIWLLISIGATALRRKPGTGFKAVRSGWLQSAVAVGVGALVMRGFAEPFSWRQACAFGLMAAAGLWFNRLFLGLIARGRKPHRWEGFRFAVAQGAALFAVHPYVRSALLGAGDAKSYSMMVADFLEQWRSGIFPILIGQSGFSLNGGFQPVRNAPYLQHLAWFFHLLGLGTFNTFALLNLTVLASMLGAVVGCYAALRISVSETPWVALGSAVLYGLCPGVLAPLYGGDMYPTFMTLPFLPWLVLGIEQSAADPDRAWPWSLQGAALAAIWLAHPPVAAWATVVVVFAAVWTVVRRPGWKVFSRITLALALFAALSGYLFISVTALKLPIVSRADALATIGYKISTLRDNWVHSFLPLSPGGNNLLGDIQLGYGIWACLLLGFAVAVREHSGRVLLGCFGLILLFTWPVPFFTNVAWHRLPSELLVITNQWPIERFYVILAAIAVFILASALSRCASQGAWKRVGVAGLLVSACLWSSAETRKLFGRAAAIVHPEDLSEDMQRLENVTLSRTHSYEYLGTPAYFSNGHMDPRLENRLLDPATQMAFADGSTYRRNSPAAPPGTFALTLNERTDGFFPESVDMKPGDALVLRFDFLGRQPAGELQITGKSLADIYTLPQSGQSKAFGSAPGNGHTLILENTSGTAEKISFRFLAGGREKEGAAFAKVTVEPLSQQERVIRLASRTPFHAFVTSNRDSYLETPKLFVPGYHASVDGAVTPYAKSSEGLVEIPLSKGEHEVTLTYVGSRLLRWSYYGSGAAWLILLAWVSRFARSVPFSGRTRPQERLDRPLPAAA